MVKIKDIQHGMNFQVVHSIGRVNADGIMGRDFMRDRTVLNFISMEFLLYDEKSPVVMKELNGITLAEISTFTVSEEQNKVEIKVLPTDEKKAKETNKEKMSTGADENMDELNRENKVKELLNFAADVDSASRTAMSNLCAEYHSAFLIPGEKLTFRLPRTRRNCSRGWD